MLKIENSEVVKHVLQKLIDISSRKTTKGHAVSTMYGLIKKLEEKYDFLRHVEIKDTRFLEDTNSVTVISDMDSVPPIEVGKAIHAIIVAMNESLGKDRGLFFIKDFCRHLGEKYVLAIRDMGVDLDLLQLELEVENIGTGLFAFYQ